MLSLLPISISGWGVRESALAFSMGVMGLPEEPIVVASVTFGLGLILSSLAGLFLIPQLVAGGESPQYRLKLEGEAG
jgi:hypothetical protein